MFTAWFSLRFWCNKMICSEMKCDVGSGSMVDGGATMLLCWCEEIKRLVDAVGRCTEVLRLEQSRSRVKKEARMC